MDNLLIIRNICFRFLAYFFISVSVNVNASEWTVRPSISIEEIYSDNINLSDVNKQSALVTDISPSVIVKGVSSRSNFDLNYNLQALYNDGGNSGININNQLLMNSHYELVDERLFIDGGSSISQQNVSNRRIVSDNVSGGNNKSTVSTIHVSPYWTPHFKNLADGEFRFTYDFVDSEGGTSQLSETESISQNIRLSSGTFFSSVSWFATFHNSKRNNSSSEDVSFQDSVIQLNYAFNKDYSVYVRGGHSNNSFSSNSNRNDNGLFYTFGGEWSPSRRINISAGYGNNSFVTLRLQPFDRLDWTTTYLNNDIGLNTGDTWETSLNYRTRRTVWSFNYNEQTTTTQQLLLDQQSITIFDQNDPSAVNQFNIRLPTLTDEVFITKRADLSVTFNTRKSDLTASVYRTKRLFESSQEDEKVTGASFSWNWKAFLRTSTLMRTSWQQTESNGVDAFSDERFDISFEVKHRIISRLRGSIEYRFVDQQSNDNLNDYSENRITARLSYRY